MLLTTKHLDLEKASILKILPVISLTYTIINAMRTQRKKKTKHYSKSILRITLKINKIVKTTSRAR